MLRIYVKNPVAPVEIPAPGLELTFDDIANVPVADAASVSDWNVFFDLPTNGSPFTSVEVIGDMVKLIGGSGITLKEYLFSESYYVTHLLTLYDNAESIVACLSGVFAETLTTYIYLPNCVTIEQSCFNLGASLIVDIPKLEHANGFSCFGSMTSQSIFDFPLLQNIGTSCFNDCNASEYNLPSLVNMGETTGTDDVFVAIIGKTITLTIPAALMTCNGGNPDGDIQYLQANNTLTIVTV